LLEVRDCDTISFGGVESDCDTYKEELQPVSFGRLCGGFALHESLSVSRKGTVYAAYSYVGSYLPETDTRIVSLIPRLRKNAQCLNHMGLEEGIMKATTLPEQRDAKSPAGADIRYLMDGETGNMIHSTVPPHQINRATVHATVSEFWYVLEGHGEVWRDDGVESCVTTLVPGTSIDIPVGTAFQYRNVSDVDLKFICIAMPPWPGDSEATYVSGKWHPTI
jgi:mannose-6-phosphate isomerase-like protein (cupin superfamily)